MFYGIRRAENVRKERKAVRGIIYAKFDVGELVVARLLFCSVLKILYT